VFSAVSSEVPRKSLKNVFFVIMRDMSRSLLVLFVAIPCFVLAGDEPRAPCPACGGAKTAPCADCNGERQMQAPCRACRAAGSNPCRPCRGKGVLRCARCNGKGYIEEWMPLAGRLQRKSCPPTVACRTCRGTGAEACKTCKGKGFVLAPCTGCGGAGTSACPECKGEGSVVDAEEILRRQESLKAEAELRAARAKRLEAFLPVLDGCASRVEKLKARGEKLEERFRALRTDVDAIAAARSSAPAIEGEIGEVQGAWKVCEEARGRSASHQEDLTAAREEAIARAKEIRAILRTSAAAGKDGADPGKGPIPEEKISFHETEARRLGQTIDDHEGALDWMERQLTSCRSALSAFETARRSHLDKVASERKKEAEKAAALERFRTALKTAGEALGLRDPKADILESKSARELQVAISIFDATAGEGRDRLPSDACLETVPSLISALFDKCPEVVRIRVRFEALLLGETGLEERRFLPQKFTMDRERWGELRRGAFRDDWRKLLEKSAPSPQYPPQGLSLPDGWQIMLVGMVIVLGLAVLFVVRAKMSG
jgi:hypothetical protein